LLGWLKTHSLVWLLALAALLTFDWLTINKKRLNAKWYASLALAVLHVAVGVLLVKLFAFMEAGFDAEKAGNMSLFGAVFFLPAAYFAGAKLSKRSIADVFDVFAVAMILTLMLARVNCLIGGCCLGLEIGAGPARWPTREAELVFYAVFLLAVAPRVKKGRSPGRAYPLFLVCYGVFRAVVECFRESEHTWGILHISHIWAILSVIIGAVALLILRKRFPVSNRSGKTGHFSKGGTK
jgi:prolipoprotein diacylglyceryltransferase